MPPPVAKPRAVIRRTRTATESVGGWLVRRLLPAWVGSGAVHAALAAALLGVSLLLAKPPADAVADEPLVVTDADPPAVAPDPATGGPHDTGPHLS